MGAMPLDPRDETELAPETRKFLEEELGASLGFIRGIREPDIELAHPARGAGAPGANGSSVEPDSSLPSAVEAPADSTRYVIESELASGGSGQILNVFDQSIGRRVAMKILRKDRRNARSEARFFEEARATGQLEHPNIPPVYDFGNHPEHGAYFTLRLVRGRTLWEILRDLSIGRLETQRQFTLTRPVQILEQVSMGIHYAHVRGVIHRDLKPENIMVGDFGEVLVLDWGVAKIGGKGHESSIQQDPVRLVRGDSIDATQDGTVSGTLSYMSPEQAKGWVDDIDQRTDVFGLGAVLYEILTFHPPHEGKSVEEVLAKATAGEVVAPRLRAPRNGIPRSLEEICLKALSASKADRYPDAMTFSGQLQVFLDGTLEAERRAREAAQLTEKGRELSREHKRIAEAESRLRLDAAKKLESFAPHDPVELKAQAWDLLDQAAQRSRERIQLFSDATALLHSAINVDPQGAAAKETLADLYWQRFEEAERSGAASEAAIYRRLVERYDTGKLARLLEDKAQLTIVSSPPGAQVFIHRLVEKGWGMVEADEKALGATPVKVELSIGQYLVALKKEGLRDTLYPLVLRRSESQIARINLYGDEEIGRGFILVPQGDSGIGGDSAAPGSLPAGRRYVGDFFVAEYPVTFREYCAFLDDLRKVEDPELARWLPRSEIEGSFVQLGPDGHHEPCPKSIDLGAETRARHASGGEACEWRLPIFGVNWFAAERYAKWLSEKQGRRVRLLKDLEWEKAARGAAGWTHPWGERFDWSLVKGGLSRPGRAQPEPVGAFPTDRSIYGVRDLAGTIREWCRDWFHEGQYRLTRGGSWFNVHEGGFRAAHRLGTRPDNASTVIGFRVAAEPQ